MAEHTFKNLLRPMAAKVGVTSSSFLWKGIALRRYQHKLRTDEDFRRWYEAEGLKSSAGHLGHRAVKEDIELMTIASQNFEITEVMRQRLGDLSASRVLDAGASDGMFLSRIGARNGVGVNLTPDCVAQIRADGFEAHLADIEHLPFADKAFDYVICCETLEHVPNPIHTINELARVCAKRIVITIPWLEKTRINAKPSNWHCSDNHIFEFNERDFAKILSHAKVRVAYQSRVQVFPEPRNPLVQWWLRLWMYSSYFPKLQYYELEPV